MDKISKILKNAVVFFVIFLIINFIFESFRGPELPPADGNLIFTTTDIEYSRRQMVTAEIKNNTDQVITIPSECPEEPFSVFRYENNEWMRKSSRPDLSCENAVDTVIQPGQSTQIRYENWNNALFSEMGRFRLEFEATIGEETKTISSNEFTIVKEGVLRQLWDGVFYKPIYNALIFISKTLPNHNLGLAIIILTLIIRTILLVPSHRAMRSQRRMQDIQPRLEKIRKKHKGDQQRIASETMAVWKEAKVNPFGSCLPLLLQFPFLIALFYVVQNGLNPDNSFLLYTEYTNFNISDIDFNFLGLDLTTNNLYVLPLIVGGLQFIQLKLSMARKQGKQKGMNKEMAAATGMMTYVMPVMIAVFTASLPAGVGIYWGTSTLYGTIQQIFVNREKTSPNSDDVKVRVINK